MPPGRKISIISLLLLPVLLVAIFSIVQIEKQFVIEVYKERSTEASLATNLVKAKFDHLQEIGLSLATQPALWAGINAKKWDAAIAAMKKIPADLQYITNVFLTDSTGRVLAESALPASYPPGSRLEFTWHRNAGNAYFSEVYKIPQAPQFVFMAHAIPLYNSQHQLSCFLILQVNVKTLLEWSNDISIGKEGYVYIVDQTGHIAFSPGLPNSDSLIDYFSVPAVQRALRGEKNVAVLYNPVARETRLSAFEQVPGIGWAVVVQEAARAALPNYSNLNLIILFYLLMISLAGFAAWFIIREIVRRRKTETALRTYTDMVEHTQVLIRNMDNRIVYWNRGMETLYGWTKEAAIGQVTHLLFKTVFPQPLPEIQNILLHTGHWKGELRHTRKDGAELCVASHWALIRDTNGIPSAILESNNDITELKKSEERVAALSRQIDQSNDAIFVADENWLVSSWNLGAEKIYGYSRQEAMGREINELLQTAMDKNELASAVSQLLVAGYWSGELKRTRKDGSQVYVYSSTSTLREAGGSITGYVGVSLDITEQVDLKNRVSYLAALVEQSSDAIVSVSLSDRTIVSWNKGAERLHGYSSSEVIGKNARALGIAKPSEADLLLAFKQVKEKGYWQSEMCFYHKNGNSFIGAVNVNLVKNLEGKITGLVFIVRDITTRKNLEKTLREYNNELENKVAERAAALHKNELRFRAIIENSQDIISLMDTAFNVIYRSPSSYKITGWTNEEIKMRGANKIHPDDREKAMEEMNRAIAEPGKLIAVTFRTQHKNGHYLWVEGTVINLLNDENIAAIVTNFRDVTEKLQAKQQLDSSEKRFRTIIENNYDSIVLMDESFKTIYRSPASSRLTGWSDEEMDLPEASKNIHPDDTEKLTAAILEAVAHPAQPVRIVYRFRHKKDYYIWVEANIINRLQDESVKALVFNSRDVTERIHAQETLAASERRFRSIIENNYDSIVLIDQSFKPIYRSPASSRDLGWTDEEMDRPEAAKNIHPDDAEKLNAAVFEAVAHPGKPVNILYRFRHKKGYYIWVESSITNRLQEEDVKAIVINSRNVTERIYAEEKLAFSEKHFRALIENNYDVISLMDASFRVFYRSPSAARITGWTDEEMLDDDGKRNIHPDDREMAAAVIKKIMANPGKPVNTIFRNRHKQGHYIWVEGIVINRLQDENVRAIVFNYRDVTERKEAEEKLVSSEKRFRALSENNYDFIILMDEQFNILYRSPSSARITGWPDEEVMHEPPLKNIHPDDLADLQSVMQQVNDAPGQPFKVLFRNLHKQGWYIWIEGIVTNRLNDENVKAVVFNAREVTERIIAEKKLASSEERFRTLIENNHDTIILIDKAFQTTYRSPAATRISGWSNEELINTEITRMIHPEDKKRIDQVLKKVMGKPDEPVHTLFRYRHKAGHYIWLECTLINRLHEDSIQAIVFNLRDVTESIKAAEKLAASEKRFRALIENNYDVITLMDQSFKLIYRSPAAFRVTGWTNEEMLTIDATLHIHADDLPAQLEQVKEVLASPGKRFELLFRMIHKQGHTIWVEGVMTNWLQDENVSAIVFNYRDVTERREGEEKLISSEQRFRLLIENSAEGISLLDQSSNVTYRSPSGYKILGNRDVKNTIAFAHPDFLADFKNKFAESLAKPGIAVPYESRYAKASGEYFWTEGSFTNLLDVKGINGVVANYRDVTKRKELEDLLNKAYALARIGGWEINMEKGTVYWSDITREIHETDAGYVPDLASGLHFYKEGATRDLITSKVNEAIKLGTAWDVELQMVTAKNNTRWIRSIGQTEFVDGKCIRIYGSFQDINERREAQEQLKASETRFRSLIENISDGIVLTNKDSEILYQSPSVTKIIGYELAERKGKNLLDFVHPDSRQDLLAFNESVSKTKDSATPFQFRFMHKDGHYMWLEGFVRNLLHDPAVNAFVSNYRDITERKEAEEALQKSEKLFRSLFENMQNGFAYYKAVFKKEKLADAVYLAANAEYESLVGLHNLTGRKVLDVLPGLLNSDGPYLNIITRVLQTGRPEKFETFMQPLKKWLSVAMYSPAKGYFVVLTDDITERKMVEQKINNINAELEKRVIKRTEELKKVNEELEAFSYSVSHDLRAPLRGIIGFTAILEEEYTSQLDAEAKRITGVIKNNTLKMGNLIDDLLMFSRMGRQQIALSHIDCNEMISHIIEELGNRPSNSAVNWVIPALPSVNGDVSAIRQVWTNLISNAVKYSATQPHPRIEILSYKQAGQLVFAVKDNGVGFEQKYSHKLFRVFQRLHAADEFEGTGVGLAIVEKIISKHGGKVWAEAVINEGASFYFSLPAG